MGFSRARLAQDRKRRSEMAARFVEADATGDSRAHTQGEAAEIRRRKKGKRRPWHRLPRRLYRQRNGRRRGRRSAQVSAVPACAARIESKRDREFSEECRTYVGNGRNDEY